MATTLEIRWKRLIDEHGHTCDRCGATENAVAEAVAMLRRAFRPMGIEVKLEKQALEPAEFRGDPLESNRIWIAGEPLETWLAAATGQSRCCNTCGDADCRTVTVDGRTYDAIPVELIVRAGLLAGARLLETPPVQCCAPAATPENGTSCCTRAQR